MKEAIRAEASKTAAGSASGTRPAGFAIFGLYLGATICDQLIDQASIRGDIGEEPTHSVGRRATPLDLRIGEFGGMSHAEMVSATTAQVAKALHNRKRPAGEAGRFWGYYREERYVSLYMWICGRWVSPVCVVGAVVGSNGAKLRRGARPKSLGASYLGTST
ncbi:MAG TPA: hypothetical protein VLL27_00520 [Solirubrobacterales bacterium]|nr:hypothetical protein [Solirubrobacterales bacterium]